jgi:hypothetical protein
MGRKAIYRVSIHLLISMPIRIMPMTLGTNLSRTLQAPAVTTFSFLHTLPTRSPAFSEHGRRSSSRKIESVIKGVIIGKDYPGNRAFWDNRSHTRCAGANGYLRIYFWSEVRQSVPQSISEYCLRKWNEESTAEVLAEANERSANRDLFCWQGALHGNE